MQIQLLWILYSEFMFARCAYVTFQTFFLSIISLLHPPTTLCGIMKKQTLIYIAAFLALTLGLMLSCAKKDGSSSSVETDTSSSQSVTVSSSVAFGNAKFGDAKFE